MFGLGVSGIVGDLAVEPTLVEPVDVRHGRELDVVEAAPVDQLPLVETVEALGERVVVAIALRPDRRDDLAHIDGRTVEEVARAVVDHQIHFV